MSRPGRMGRLSCYRHASIIWLMALLVLFAALAPTVSRIMASNDVVGGIWVEVCSVSGTKLVQVDTQEGSTEQPASIQVDHCPFCLPQFQFRAVPALGIALPAGQSACESVLRLPVIAPTHAHNQWRPDRSRAPPAIS